jgi:hypothetical protein
MPLPKYRRKLSALFHQISDEDLRNIISEVIDVEYENRSLANFPHKRIEDIVDNNANLIEMRRRMKEGQL